MNLKLQALLDEVNGEGSDLGGGGAPDAGAGSDGAQGDGAAKPDAGAPAAPVDVTAGMLGAIKEGLAAGGVVDLPEVKPDAAKPAAPAVGDQKPAATPDAAKADADKLAADALLKKKPDDFKMTDQERAVLGPKAQARFQELTHYGKVQYERADRLQQDNTQLVTARDSLLKTFADAKAESSDLIGLLDLNYRMKSGDLEGALNIIENTRAGLLKTLGREGPGVDLLAEHADLKARVDNQEISRADALELANNRRQNAQRQQQDNAQRQQQTQQTQAQQTQQQALGAIQAWCKQTAAADIDYAAREAKIEPQIAAIMKDYPADLWLPTIKRLYESVTVTKAPVIPMGGNSLRPNGAKPGPKAPASMLDAIKTGLNYSTGN